MEIRTNRGESLEAMSAETPILLIFLRHFGCTFCRETMAEIAHQRREIESRGLEIVIVHMVDQEVASQILSVYDLNNVRHISDPHQSLYRKFGLGRVSFHAMFGVRNWWRAFVAGLVKGHLIGKPAGDPWQMPGVFVYHHSEIMNKFDYKFVSDLPDFVGLSKMA